MAIQKPGRLIFLSGPSCMGKGTLVKVLKKFHRELYDNLKRVVLYNSRPPRPGETDGVEFHFRPRAYVEKMVKDKGLLAIEVRGGDLHAVNVNKLHKIVKKHDAILIDTPYMVKALREHPDMPQVPILSIIMVPISQEEILFYKSMASQVFPLEDFVTDLMRRKLLRRTLKQKNILSLKDLEQIELRAHFAYPELKEAHHFDYVLVNHEGGDAEYWSSFYYPVGDPLKCLNAFADLLRGKQPAWAEKWDKDLVP
jgi:guanylate kinase